MSSTEFNATLLAVRRHHGAAPVALEILSQPTSFAIGVPVVLRVRASSTGTEHTGRTLLLTTRWSRDAEIHYSFAKSGEAVDLPGYAYNNKGVHLVEVTASNLIGGFATHLFRLAPASHPMRGHDLLAGVPESTRDRRGKTTVDEGGNLRSAAPGFLVDSSRALASAGTSFTLAFKVRFQLNADHTVWWGPVLYHTRAEEWTIRVTAVQEERICVINEMEGCRAPLGCGCCEFCAFPPALGIRVESLAGEGGGGKAGANPHPAVEHLVPVESFVSGDHFVTVTVAVSSIRIYIDGVHSGSGYPSLYGGHGGFVAGVDRAELGSEYPNWGAGSDEVWVQQARLYTWALDPAEVATARSPR